jgi:hypothetical protein
MQTLGVSDSTPKSESRLKSLFWPSIQSGSDVDYLGIQGYWVCTFVAVVTMAFGLLALGSARSLAQMAFLAMVSGIVFLFYYLGGIGVREGSRFAAAMVFAMYALDMAFYLAGSVNGNGLVSLFVAPGSVIRLLVKATVTVVLFCNLRATWVAASWAPGSVESALPLRRSETWSDRFVDQWPSWIWPKIRIPYIVFALLMLALWFFGSFLFIIVRLAQLVR